MATLLDKSIRLSVEETDGFIDISRGKNKEEQNGERHGGGGKAPVPSYIPTITKMRGTEPDGQISEIWKYITENLRQFGQISWELLHRLYKCCLEEPNVRKLLQLVMLHCCRCAKGSSNLIVVVARRTILRIVGCFRKKNVRQENATIHRTDLNETKIQIDDDDDDDDDDECQATF